MTCVPTVISCLRETVRQFPDRAAVSDANRTVTYRELWQEAERHAAQLVQRGVARGQVNLVEARASVDFAVAAMGTYLAGCIFVPFAKNAPDAVIRRIREETATDLGPDVADVLYTTGTTDASKGVVLSHRAVWASADNNRHFDGITENTVYLIASPLNHVSALRKLYACFLVGAHAVLQDGFVDIRRYYEAIERHRVNALLLPPVAVTLLTLVSRDRLLALSEQIKVVHSNGSPMTEVQKESLRRCLPKAHLIFAYGATEAGSACCAYDYAEFPGRTNCVGRVSPHARIKAEDGRLVVAGDCVMNGYLNDPTHTADVLRGGWLSTHDLGRIDEDGFVYVIGREDDIINCGGLKVAPSVVEETAMRHPGILDCVCFGVNDSLSGQAVKLLVVPEDAHGFDLADFRHFLQERLERHQLPTRIACVARIPRTRNGKADRKQLTGLKFETPPGFRWDAILKGLGERGQRL